MPIPHEVYILDKDQNNHNIFCDALSSSLSLDSIRYFDSSTKFQDYLRDNKTKKPILLFISLKSEKILGYFDPIILVEDKIRYNRIYVIAYGLDGEQMNTETISLYEEKKVHELWSSVPNQLEINAILHKFSTFMDQNYIESIHRELSPPSYLNDPDPLLTGLPPIDIALCEGESCHLKGNCHRYYEIPKNRDPYFYRRLNSPLTYLEPSFFEEECEDYWPIKWPYDVDDDVSVSKPGV